MKKDTKSILAMPPPAMVTDGCYQSYSQVNDPASKWDAQEMHLRDYFEVILRRKWMVANCLMVVFALILIYSLSQTKLYKASTTIEVGTEDQNVTKFEEVETSNLRAAEYYDTQLQLIQSREIVGRVVDRFDLAGHPVVAKAVTGAFEPGPIERLKGMLSDVFRRILPAKKLNSDDGVQMSEENIKRQALIDYVFDGLDVSSRRTGMLVEISFVSPDRHLSQAVANGMAEEFIAWRNEKKLEGLDSARSFLMNQIDRAKINLEQAEKALQKFAKQAGIVSMDTKLNSVIGQLEKLNEALAAAKADLIEKKAAYQQAKKDGPSALPEVMASQMIGQLKAEYVSVQSEYRRLSATFRIEYPAVKALIGRMNSIQDRIHAEEQKVLSSIKYRYESARAKVDQMETRLEYQKQQTLKLNERTTQYAVLAREVETNKQIYQSLLERSREIESMAGIGSSNIHVVDAAVPPLYASKPNVQRNLLLASILGLMGGIGMAFFLEYFADHVANPNEISDRFQISILGVVPLVRKKNFQLEKGILEVPQTPFAEAMRTTRVSLQLSGAARKNKSCVITSTQVGEGKTTLASNLALSFAEAGESVVVVDADLRRSRMHKIFNMHDDQFNGSGLSSYLAGATTLKQLQPDNISNLRLIPAGPPASHPVELLASHRFAELIRILENSFDRVIVDGPPHQGFADVMVISQHVGGVVLVGTIGKTSRGSLHHFRRSMININADILGCVVNKVDLNKRYGYHSCYDNYIYHDSSTSMAWEGNKRINS